MIRNIILFALWHVVETKEEFVRVLKLDLHLLPPVEDGVIPSSTYILVKQRLLESLAVCPQLCELLLCVPHPVHLLLVHLLHSIFALSARWYVLITQQSSRTRISSVS